MLSMSTGYVSAPQAATGVEMPSTVEGLGTNQLVLRDRLLFGQGDEARYIYRILSGVVRTYRLMSDGRRHVADFLMAGDLLGFETGEEHNFSAEAVVDCVMRRYPRRQLELAANDHPIVARRLLSLACDRLAVAQSQMVSLGRKTAEERFASFLLGLVDRVRGADRAIALPMTRTDIADHLGLTIETVSRLFSRLRKDRVIDLPDAHSFRLLDRDALEERSAVCEMV
jgi:CRP-like cAMP-binding protein